MPIINFDAATEADFLRGEWLKELDIEYRAYLAAGNVNKVYWQELYAALVYLWNPSLRESFIKQVENQWKITTPYHQRDNYAYIPISTTDPLYKTNSYPQGAMLHVQYNCPGSINFVADTMELRLKYASRIIDFNDPNKEYLEPLKAAIKSMHLVTYNAFTQAKNTGNQNIVRQLFNAPSYGCLNEKIRKIQDYELGIAKGLTFDKVIEMILSDYTRHITQAMGWPTMTYNDLAVKDGGKYFYLEDITEYAISAHGGVISADGKKVRLHFEATVEAWGLSDRRPAGQDAAQLIVAAPATGAPFMPLPQPAPALGAPFLHAFANMGAPQPQAVGSPALPAAALDPAAERARKLALAKAKMKF